MKPLLISALLALPLAVLGSPHHLRPRQTLTATGDACPGDDSTSDQSCDSGFCSAGVCTDPSATTGIADGGHCVSDSNCNSGSTCDTTSDPSVCSSGGGGGGLSLGQPCGGDTDADDATCDSGWCSGSVCSDPTAPASVADNGHCVDDGNCSGTGSICDTSSDPKICVAGSGGLIATGSTCSGENEGGDTSCQSGFCGSSGNCETPPVGTVADNGHCFNDDSCSTAGSTCDTNVDPKVCTPASGTLIPTGTACPLGDSVAGDASCSSGFCSASSGNCEAVPTSGSVADGDHCVDATSCSSSGATCGGDPQVCTPSTTSTLLPNGDACNVGPNGEDDDFVCQSSFCSKGSCADPSTTTGLAPDDRCVSDDNCQQGTRCVGPNFPYVCAVTEVPPYDLGGFCEGPEWCKSLNCDSGTCGEVQIGTTEEGQPCTDNSNCKSAFCTFSGSETSGDQTCQAPFSRNDGEACSSAQQCSASRCESNTCQYEITTEIVNQGTTPVTYVYPIIQYVTVKGGPTQVVLAPGAVRTPVQANGGGGGGGVTRPVTTPTRTGSTSASRTASASRSASTPARTSSGAQRLAIAGSTIGGGIVAFLFYLLA